MSTTPYTQWQSIPFRTFVGEVQGVGTVIEFPAGSRYDVIIEVAFDTGNGATVKLDNNGVLTQIGGGG